MIKATEAQILYIEQLAIDLSFNRVSRNANISSILEREVKFLDELTKEEASKVIDMFKYYKHS